MRHKPIVTRAEQAMTRFGWMILHWGEGLLVLVLLPGITRRVLNR